MGKLADVASSLSTSQILPFDNLGRLLNSQQITDGQTYNFAYSYNLSGALVNQTYPSGRIVTNQFETDGDLAQVNGSFQGNNKTYVGNFTYTSAGAVSSLQLGNGRWENTVFNSRLQPIQIGLGNSQTTQDLWKVNYDYGQADNNGNVKNQTITVPNQFTALQNYTYDSLNRLKSAQESISNSETWKQTFSFDRYGNRKFDASQTTTLGNCPQNICNPDINPANNRIVGSNFDNAGNTTQDAEGRQFFYDAENKQKEVRDAQNNIIGQYLYDGDGKRVKKIAANDTTIFVYDAAGKLASEYLITTSNSQAPVTSYLTNDTLGSPRVTTDSSGNVVSRRDFRPYGEEIYRQGQGTDKVRQKFTSYERDNETDLDFAQARMFGSSLGRFTSPDPLMASARKINPQTFNRYTYVTNNPLNFVDPLGMEGCDPKTDPSCAEKGPLGTPNLIKPPGSALGTFASVNIIGQAAPVIETAVSELSTQFIPRALESLPSLSSVLTGAGRLASVPGMILTMPGTANPTNCPSDVCPAGTGEPIGDRAKTGTTTITATATETNDDKSSSDILYRGVTNGHPGYNEALLGIARPRGGTASPQDHNEWEDTRSPYTSWTRSYDMANYWANRNVGGGVILTARIPKERQVTSPDVYREQEVLVTGVVTGANVTLIKPK